MKISYNWLKEFVNLPAAATIDEVAARLTMSTVEVEDIINQSESFQNMVVGEILTIVKHPDADKLQLCQVDIGSNKHIQIVCGATNIYQGFKGIVALPGAKVRWHGQGELVTLEAAKIRGVESFGMICAASEIGLGGGLEAGVLELAKDIKVGLSAAEALGFNDQVLEIDNKSMNHRPDLWGHLGLAREVAAIYQTDFYLPKVEDLKKVTKKGELKVEVENELDCPRYLGVLIKNVKIEPSPKWLQQGLIAVGSKPINVLVDLTNYVMLETAEPLHAFDAAKLADKTIVVRRATKGESITCLDDKVYKLDESVLVIADNDKPIALAGIMGGKNSAISETTVEIILEAANFEPVLIRKASLKLNLRTDASARFEKSQDPYLPQLAVERFLTLLKSIQPQIEISSLVDNFPKPPTPLVIELPVEFAQKRIGNNLEPKVMKDILERLSFGISARGGSAFGGKDKKGIWQVTVPSFRATKDIKEPIDLVEEIARIYGYDNLTAKLPHIDLNLPEPNIFKTKERQAKNWLSLAGGLTEVYNYLFVGADQLTNLGFNPKEVIEVKNPVAPDQNLLRPSLVPSLIKNLADNLRWQDDLAFFELDRVFENKPGEFNVDHTKKEFLSKQPYHMGLAWLVKKDDRQAFFKAKGLLEGLLNELQVEFNWALPKLAPVWAEEEAGLDLVNEQGVLGHLSFLNPNYQSLLVLGKKDSFTAILAEIDFQILVKGVSEGRYYQAAPKFPQVTEDLAIVVEEKITWQAVQTSIVKAGRYLKEVALFDVYHLAEDQKSLAFRLTFESPDKTLTSDEVKQIKEKIIAQLQAEFKAILR